MIFNTGVPFVTLKFSSFHCGYGITATETIALKVKAIKVKDVFTLLSDAVSLTHLSSYRKSCYEVASLVWSP